MSGSLKTRAGDELFRSLLVRKGDCFRTLLTMGRNNGADSFPQPPLNSSYGWVLRLRISIP